jgi:hypothetical protein
MRLSDPDKIQKIVPKETSLEVQGCEQARGR